MDRNQFNSPISQRRKSWFASLFTTVCIAGFLTASASCLAAARPAGIGQDAAAAASTQSGQAADNSSQPEDKASNSNQISSEAEKISDLERTIEAQARRLRELEADVTSPDGEFAKSEREFRDLDVELDQKRERIQQLKKEGNAQEVAVLEAEVKSLDTQWRLAKERFELAIEERKTMREEIATLKLKLEKDREALDELTGGSEPNKSEGDGESDRSMGDGRDEAASGRATPKITAKSLLTGGRFAAGEADAASEGDVASSSKTAGESDEPVDEELMRAEALAKEKEEDAEEAQEEVQSIAARIAALQKLIGQEQKGLALARKKADLALATQRALEEELPKKVAEQAAAAELDELRAGIAQAKARYDQARTDITDSTDRLNDLRSELAALQSQQILALQEANKKRSEAEAAQEKVEGLRNPFALRNILQWCIDHGPRLFLIIFGMVLLDQLAKFFGHRTIKLIASATGRGTTAERENRAKTLVGVFQNAVSVAIFVGGVLMALEEAGANVTVLMGGVAVVGLAVAFGAQNLIKDYFYGFVMLMENQYMLNDVIKIGELAGQVERITLRMTVLRDASGVVHFIPNGTINSVSNETHGWSRASFEIGVAYKENVDQVICVLAEMGGEMRHDPNYGPMILDDPTQPGVDSLGESAVVIKFFIKTRPHQQGAVKRELLRRIKNRFDELGIELPFPHRTIYHRHDGIALPIDIAPIKKCA